MYLIQGLVTDWTVSGFIVVDSETCYRPCQSGDLMYLIQRLLTGWMAWGFDVVGKTFNWLDGLGI